MKKLQEFEKNSMILFVLLMGANVCNYLFQIIIGNLMSVTDYGVVNTMLGVVGVLSIPTTIITMICARYIALYNTNKDMDGIMSTLKFLLKFVILVSFLLFFAGMASIKKISYILGLDTNVYIFGSLCIAVVNLFFSVTSGSLQGLKLFLPYGIQTIMVAAGKLLLSIGLIVIGWRVYGVLFAIFSGTVLSILYGVNCVKKYIGDVAYDKNQQIDIREFLKYAVAAIVAQGCVIAITNGDVLLVKIYFSDVETGIYSSASVIGKIAMYVSTAVVAALFPLVVEKNQKGEDTFPLFKKALFYGGGISVVSGIGMSLLGKYVISILFGERYQDAVRYLPYVCMFVVPLTFVTILMNYVLAMNKIKLFGISIAFGLVGIINLSLVMHEEVAYLMMLCGIVLSAVFICNIIWLMKDKKRR